MTDRPLSPRDGEVLRLLARYRFLAAVQVEGFLFDGSVMTTGSRLALTKRSLFRLRERGYLVGLPRPLSTIGAPGARVAYQLTARGNDAARLLDPGLRTNWTPARTAVFLTHCLVAADLGLAFRRAARAGCHRVIEWELEENAAARLGSKAVVPDAFLVYGTPECELHACIEVDLGTEHPGVFAQKVRRYLELHRGGTWRERIRAWPVVITVVPTAGRADMLQRATEGVLQAEPDGGALRAATEFDFATVEDATSSSGPLRPIWRIAGRPGIHPLIPLADGHTNLVQEPVPGPYFASPPPGSLRRVYVIELEDVERPRQTALPCVYVGQSAQPAAIRFAQHKAGYKASRVARRFGRQLRPDLSGHIAGTPDWATALRNEAALAAELRRANYCVHGGH